MSTRSCIIIKLRDEDIKTQQKFDLNKLPKNVVRDTWANYGEESKKEPRKVELKRPYVGIYCHFDGYKDGVGAALKQKYNTYEKVLNLILGGSASYVEADKLKHYANRQGEKWDWIKPIQGNTPQEVADRIDHQYAYLFEDNRWLCNDYGKTYYTY